MVYWSKIHTLLNVIFIQRFTLYDLIIVIRLFLCDNILNNLKELPLQSMAHTVVRLLSLAFDLVRIHTKCAIIIINYCQIITTSTAIIPYPNQIKDKKNNYISTSTTKKIFFFLDFCCFISFSFRMTKTQITHIIYADEFIHTERATNTI